MSDVTMLGVIAGGLGVYCVYLQWRLDRLFVLSQVILCGIYEGTTEVKKEGKVYFPVLKKQ